MQQIAAWLFSNPVTEELAHGLETGKGKSGSTESQSPPIFHVCNENECTGGSSSHRNHLRDEALFHRHADEILKPPPNS